MAHAGNGMIAFGGIENARASAFSREPYGVWAELF